MKNHTIAEFCAPTICCGMDKKINPRITIVFSDEAAEWLNAQATRRSISVSDLLRRIVDEVRGAYIVPRQDRRDPGSC